MAKGDVQYMTWTQNKNPLASFSTDMKPSNVIYSNGQIPYKSDTYIRTFNGLSVSSGPETLLDGLGDHPFWYWSVGYNKFE